MRINWGAIGLGEITARFCGELGRSETGRLVGVAAFTLMPGVKVQGCQLSAGSAGPITRRLIAAWNDLVGLDYIAQAREYLEETGDDAYCGTTTYRFGTKST